MPFCENDFSRNLVQAEYRKGRWIY